MRRDLSLQNKRIGKASLASQSTLKVVHHQVDLQPHQYKGTKRKQPEAPSVRSIQGRLRDNLHFQSVSDTTNKANINDLVKEEKNTIM